ncbi:MAG: hypothetical protein AAGA11_07875 [Pseudomonadota bacterium]
MLIDTRSLFLALGLCSIGPSVGATAALEPLRAVGFDAEGVSIEVRSHGCTHAHDFVLDWVFVEQTPVALQVRRERPDRCRGKPRWVRLRFDVNHTFSRDIDVTNPFSAWARSPQ